MDTSSPELEAALDLLHTGRDPLFLTGPAGSGKSTLLRTFLEQTSQRVAILAPTGVAALNVGGQTIHSFFTFRGDITPEGVDGIRMRREQVNLYKFLDSIVIDEVSMLRADLLDCIDAFLKRFGPHRGQPFGGVRMILVGDMAQLPPVVTSSDGDRFETEYESPYFFHAKSLQHVKLQSIALTHVYRQQDDLFLRVLTAIRSGIISERQLEYLNQRCLNEEGDWLEDNVVITLTTTNALADRINESALRSLETKPFTLLGRLSGTMNERDLPTKQELILKPGAQVMLLKNDPAGRYVNGSLGVVEDVTGSGKEQTVQVHLDTGSVVDVAPYTWEQHKYRANTDDEKVASTVVGSFTQFPLRLAWAVTIHKAQGKTFEKVVLDLGWGTFASGQLYVALSRCRTLEGIRLRQPLEARHVMSDERLRAFLTTGASQ